MSYLYCLFIVFLVTGCSRSPLPSSHSCRADFKKSSLDLTFGAADLIEINRLKVIIHPKYNIPITKLKVNNEEMEAWLDTGAASLNVSMPREDLLRLKAVPNGKEVQFCGCEGKILKAQQYDGSVSFGGKRFEPVSLMEHKDWSGINRETESDFFRINAFIGLSLLKRFNFLLDFDKNIIVLYTSDVDLPPYTNRIWHKVPFFVTSNGLEIPIRIGAAFLRGIIDTGSSHSFFIQSHPLIQKDVIKEIGCDEEGLKEVIIKDMRIGNQFTIDQSLIFTRRNLKFPEVNFIIGYNFIKRYKLFFDFKNEALWIQNA